MSEKHGHTTNQSSTLSSILTLKDARQQPDKLYCKRKHVRDTGYFKDRLLQFSQLCRNCALRLAHLVTAMHSNMFMKVTALLLASLCLPSCTPCNCDVFSPVLLVPLCQGCDGHIQGVLVYFAPFGCSSTTTITIVPVLSTFTAVAISVSGRWRNLRVFNGYK